MSECCRCIYCVDNIKYLRPPLGVVLFVMNLIGLILFFIPHRKSSSIIYSDEVFIEKEKSLPLSVHSIQRTPYEGDFFERVPSRAVKFDENEKPRRRSSSLSHFSITMDEIDKKLKEKLGKINSYEESPVRKMIRTRKQTLFPKPSDIKEDSPVKEVILPKEEIPEKEKTPPPVKAPSFLSLEKEKTPEVVPEKDKSPDVEPVKEITPEKEIMPEKEITPEKEMPDKIDEDSPEHSKSVLEFLEEKSPESIKTIFTRRKDPSSLSFTSKHSSSPRSKKLRAGSSKSSVTSTSIGPDFEAMALTKIIRHELGYFVDKKYSPDKNDTIVQNNEIEFLHFHEELLKVQKRIEAKLNSLLTNDPKCIYAKSLKQNFPSIKKTNEQKMNDALHILESLKNKEKRKIHKIDQLRQKIVKKRMNQFKEVDSSDHVKQPLNIKPSLANEHGNIFNGIFDKSLSNFDSHCDRLKNLKVLESELRRISDVISDNINRLHSIFENHEKKKKNQVYSLNSCLISELPHCKKSLKEKKTKKKNKKGPKVKKICRRFENGQIDSETHERNEMSSENEFFSISKVLDLLETPKKLPVNCSLEEKPGQVAKVIEFSRKDSFWKSSFDIVLQYSDASNRIKY